MDSGGQGSLTGPIHHARRCTASRAHVSRRLTSLKQAFCIGRLINPASFIILDHPVRDSDDSNVLHLSYHLLPFCMSTPTSDYSAIILCMYMSRVLLFVQLYLLISLLRVASVPVYLSTLFRTTMFQYNVVGRVEQPSYYILRGPMKSTRWYSWMYRYNDKGKRKLVQKLSMRC